MFDCLILFRHTALRYATMLCHLYIYTRLPVRWVVDCTSTWKESSDTIRLWIWYHSVKACAKTWQIWWVIFVLVTKCVCTNSFAYHTISYHVMLYHIIRFIYIYIYWYCDSHRSIYENVDISWYLGTTTLCFWSLQWLPCPRMVWPEAPGETGPTTQHLLCAPSRMNSACRPPWASGIPQVSRPTEAWRTSSDVVLPRSSMVAFRCWPPWDTSPQWLGNAGAAFKIVSVQYVFVNVSMSAITLCSCGIYWQFVYLDGTIPRRSLANSLATYLHQLVWSSPMCLMVWLPSQRSQLQDRVEATGSIWTSKLHISKCIM